MYFFMDTYPILHVYNLCMYVIFMYDIFDVVKEGSRSHLQVGIYTMHHFLPLSIYLSIHMFCTCVNFYVDCRYWVSTSLKCQDERTLLHYLNGKRGKINSWVQTFKPFVLKKIRTNNWVDYLTNVSYNVNSWL